MAPSDQAVANFELAGLELTETFGFDDWRGVQEEVRRRLSRQDSNNYVAADHSSVLPGRQAITITRGEYSCTDAHWRRKVVVLSSTGRREFGCLVLGVSAHFASGQRRFCQASPLLSLRSSL